MRAYQFKDSQYGDEKDCPLARTAKETFLTDDCTEGVRELQVKGKRFIHKLYTPAEYEQDMKIAEALDFGEGVVREMKLLA